MKKLSRIIEQKAEQSRISKIADKETFVQFVHEKFQTNLTYTKLRTDMIIESVLDKYPEDFQKAMKELENF